MKKNMNKYKMTISRLTIDKLGVKLYDKVSAVIAELVANSYDADATEVVIRAPMDGYLAEKEKGIVKDKRLTVEIEDNGIGMTPEEVNAFYLIVGAERRLDIRRGDTSRIHNRRVMGRKGVGKLAPFGICHKVEIITSGGELIEGKDKSGKRTRGYLTAHLKLDRRKILNETDKPYYPDASDLDGTVSAARGTKIILSDFEYRRVSKIEQLSRQLAQRFGIRSSYWRVDLVDINKKTGEAGHKVRVGDFDVPTLENTKIIFRDRKAFIGDIEHETLRGGFEREGKFYELIGWLAYSRAPYKDDLMAGVRIYCRGKIAAQTNIFGLKAGFTGEYDVRSYLVGELHADWLDEEEDLIQTDRRDVLWSHDLGQGFQEWGQNLIKIVGKLSRDPLKKRIWDIFVETANPDKVIEDAFPGNEFIGVRNNAKNLIQTIAKTMREEEVQNKDDIDNIIQLCLDLAPHITLERSLLEAANQQTPLAQVGQLLRMARIAELSSYGRIAENRVKVIRKLEELKDAPTADEADCQELITEAPWLIEGAWTPITSNKSLSTFKKEFERYYKDKTRNVISLQDFSESGKRPDFISFNISSTLEIVEIKKPHYKLANTDFERINAYVEQFRNFVNEPAQKELLKSFMPNGFKITLICDELGLTGVSQTAFNGLKNDGTVRLMSWANLFDIAQKVHEDFLAEAGRLKKLAVVSSEKSI